MMITMHKLSKQSRIAGLVGGLLFVTGVIELVARMR
jgi:hypothetical protein